MKLNFNKIISKSGTEITGFDTGSRFSKGGKITIAVEDRKERLRRPCTLGP